MPASELNIEWIVREVVRRLRDAGPAGARRKSVEAKTNNDLVIEDRLVTLETLRNRLGNTRKVVVHARAIVTPAVVDELKDRGISLSRTGAGDELAAARTPSEIHRPLVFVAVDGVDVDALQKMCGANAMVDCCGKAADWLSAVEQSVEAGKVAVLITDAPAAAAVTANRNANMRAAVGFNFPAVQQAVSEANANLLTIAPRGKSTVELFGLINEFINRH